MAVIQPIKMEVDLKGTIPTVSVGPRDVLVVRARGTLNQAERQALEIRFCAVFQLTQVLVIDESLDLCVAHQLEVPWL